MQNMPILKFEKSCTYLTEQLDIQNNNKQLILDIISNIGLLSDEKNTTQYENILEEANDFLKKISSNITKIEQLHLEIQNITKELSSILSDQNQGTKTKEFYIAAFSNIKHTVVEYSEKFQEMQTILSNDNNEFNNFINDNNFKYNFVVIDENTNSYTFTGFSIDEPTEESLETTNIENSIQDYTETETIVEESLVDEINNIAENNTENEIENIAKNTIENEIKTTESSNEVLEITSKIDNLTNEFRELLVHLSESNIPGTNVTDSLTSMFKSILSNSNSDEISEISQEPSINSDELITDVLEEDSISIDDDLLNEALLEDALLEDVLTEETLIEESPNSNSVSSSEDLEIFEDTSKEISNENISESNEDIYNKFALDTSAIFQQFMLEKLKNDFIEATQHLFNDESLLESNSDNTSIENEINDSDNFSVEDEIDTLDDTSTMEKIDTEIDILDDTFIEDENDILNEDEGINEDIVNNIVENVLNIFVEPKQEDTENTQLTDSSTTSNTSNSFYHMNDMEESIFSEYTSFEPARPVVNYFKEPEKFIEIDTPFASSKQSSSISSLSSVDNNIIEDITDNITTDENSDIIKDSIINTEDFEISFNDMDTNFIEESIFEELTKLDTSTESKDDVKEKNEMLDSLLHSEEPSKNKNLTKNDFATKLKKIQEATEDNKTLLISEKLQKIYLPYKLSELVNYVESYPGTYKSLKDVVEQEFILPFNYFKRNPSKSRFTETYNLLKNREGRTFIKSVSYAFRLLKKNNLNPAIIASCKTQHELDSYIYYLDSNNLNNFKFFDIIYEINPM